MAAVAAAILAPAPPAAAIHPDYRCVAALALAAAATVWPDSATRPARLWIVPQHLHL